MITEDYVSFEVAKLLKDKGFDEGCRAHYGGDGSFSYEKYEVEASGCEMHNAILAPTLQMTMKWLREMYNIYIVITPSMFWGKYNVSIYKKGNIYPYGFDGDSLISSYEKAVENAIKYCLENLI